MVVRKSWRSSVYDTGVHRTGADFYNFDHRLVVSEMKVVLSIAMKPKRSLIDIELKLDVSEH